METNTTISITPSTATMPFRRSGIEYAVPDVPVTFRKGEPFLNGQIVDVIQRRITVDLIRRGVVHPETFLAMRRIARIKAKDLAGLLGVRAETVSAWENGHTALPLLAYVALAGLFLEHIGEPVKMSEILGAVVRAEPPPERVELAIDFDAAREARPEAA